MSVALTSAQCISLLPFLALKRINVWMFLANTADGSASPAKLVDLISDASLAIIKLKPSVVRTSNDVSMREKCQIASFSTS